MYSANISHRGGNGRPRTSGQPVEQVRSMLQDRPQLGIREAASAIDISTATVHRNLRKCLLMYPYKLQNFHALQNSDKIERLWFTRNCQNQTERYSEYLSKIVFSDECIFRLNGSVTSKMWGFGVLNVLLKVTSHLCLTQVLWYGVLFRKKRILTDIFSRMRALMVKTIETCYSIMPFHALHL